MVFSSENIAEAQKSDSYKNAALENIATRTSVRSYLHKPVEAAQIEQLLRAGMAAPSAVNKQPWHFVVVTDRAQLKELAKANPYAGMAAHAPLAIVVCGDMKKALDGEARMFWVQDCSAATENMLLAITAKGLGGVWTGVYPIKKRTAELQAALGLPKNIIPLDVVLLGYPKHTPTPKDKWDPENIHWEKW